MKLSVIVPAYNAERHLIDCLSSLYRQQVPTNDFEIIVVNDGSTDSTKELVLDFSITKTNIRLVTQENKGNGGARNTGVSHAKGRYIYFLDADDYLADDTLHGILELAIQEDVDIIGFTSKKVNHSNDTKTHSIFPNYTPQTTSGIRFLASHNYEAEVWWYMTKRSFYVATDTKFYERKFVQDSYITPTLFSKATRVLFLDYEVHRYRMSTNSITRKKSNDHLNKHLEDLYFAIKKLHELRMNLSSKVDIDPICLQRIHVKQQRYVFIAITRFNKTQLPITHLKEMLSKLTAYEAYPLNVFMTLPDYKNLKYQVLTIIYNRPWLLFPIIRLFRRLQSKH